MSYFLVISRKYVAVGVYLSLKSLLYFPFSSSSSCPSRSPHRQKYIYNYTLIIIYIQYSTHSTYFMKTFPCPFVSLSNAEGSSDGVTVFCMKDRMRIDIERSKINGIKAIDLRLNDPLCKAKHNNTHYSLETPLVGCGTESKHAKDFIVYSNEVQEPRQTENLISRIPDLTVPFACLYSKEGVTSSYGLKPKNKVSRTLARIFNKVLYLKEIRSRRKNGQMSLLNTAWRLGSLMV